VSREEKLRCFLFGILADLFMILVRPDFLEGDTWIHRPCYNCWTHSGFSSSISPGRDT